LFNSINSTNGVITFALSPFARLLTIDLLNVVLPVCTYTSHAFSPYTLVHKFGNMIVCNIVALNHMEMFMFTLQIFCNNKYKFCTCSYGKCCKWKNRLCGYKFGNMLNILCEIKFLMNIFMAS
jgi:hypothetical protein